MASAELRSTAKWVITALAAVATVVFGAGPVVSRPSLDFHDDALQLVIAGVLGVAGLIGIGMLIFGVSKVLLPVEVSLDNLPADLVEKIDSAPESVLPADAHSLREFRDQLAAYRVAAVELPDKAEDADQRAADAYDKDPAVHAAATQEARELRNAYDDVAANLALYESVRTDVIDRGAYTKLSQVFSGKQGVWIAGALMAGIGGLGFQLALTSSPSGSEPAAKAAAVNQVAMLSGSGARATQFWTTYGLKACETTGGQVPVLVTGGEGTADSPYVVQTLPSKVQAVPSNVPTVPSNVPTVPSEPACPALTFNADPEVFALVVPKRQEITITVKKK
ncbi:hypothetical protein AB0E69_21305 [Kribbella sp. NPDC026611]|uniref:hypothetical protein n=1 Tax=Kribbella sp. NPDC026611 TaxID=3154911 RepID=UPI0033C914E1